MSSTPSTPSTVQVEWRLLPKLVGPHTIDPDQRWTRHSRCSPRRAQSVLRALRARPDMRGIVQFRLRPNRH